MNMKIKSRKKNSFQKVMKELNRSKYGLALVMTIDTERAKMKAVKQMTARLKYRRLRTLAGSISLA